LFFALFQKFQKSCKKVLLKVKVYFKKITKKNLKLYFSEFSPEESLPFVILPLNSKICKTFLTKIKSNDNQKMLLFEIKFFMAVHKKTLLPHLAQISQTTNMVLNVYKVHKNHII